MGLIPAAKAPNPYIKAPPAAVTRALDVAYQAVNKTDAPNQIFIGFQLRHLSPYGNDLFTVAELPINGARKFAENLLGYIKNTQQKLMEMRVRTAGGTIFTNEDRLTGISMRRVFG